MIILTVDEADKVRGLSMKGHALAPMLLADGTYCLPDDVIDDPAHVGVSNFLKSLPKREVDFGKLGAKPGDPVVGGEVEANAVKVERCMFKSSWAVGVKVKVGAAAATVTKIGIR